MNNAKLLNTVPHFLLACLYLNGLTGCALVEMSGTMTKKTGEVISQYSEQNDGFIGKLAGFGGRINTTVGEKVESLARRGKRGEIQGSKTEQFVSANKEVLDSAFDAASNKALSENKAITEAQKRLQALGYDPGPADGIMRKKTFIAIEEFQKDRELKPTRRLDQATLSTLGIQGSID